jgi:hypothetical protein
MPTPTSVPTQETPVTSTDTADLLAEVAGWTRRNRWSVASFRQTKR